MRSYKLTLAGATSGDNKASVTVANRGTAKRVRWGLTGLTEATVIQVTTSPSNTFALGDNPMDLATIAVPCGPVAGTPAAATFGDATNGQFDLKHPLAERTTLYVHVYNPIGGSPQVDGDVFVDVE